MKILAGFSEEVLRFQDAPSDYISLEAGFDPEELSFGAPLTCDLTLTNRSPFPVSLGEGSLMSARVLVSVSRDPADGDAPTRYDNYLQIPMAHRYTLGPGESIIGLAGLYLALPLYRSVGNRSRGGCRCEHSDPPAASDENHRTRKQLITPDQLVQNLDSSKTPAHREGPQT